jgi:hypothetical protein
VQRDAVHVAGEPNILLWVEGTVMSHLCGLRPRAATPATYSRLLELDPRARRCALSHAIERAVGARSAHLRRYFDVADFKVAVVDHLESQIATGESSPVRDHTRWQAGPFRFRDVKTTVENHRKRNRPLEPGKRAEWRKRGLAVKDDQTLDQIEAHLLALARAEDRGGILGDASQTGLLDAVAGATGGRTADSVRMAFGEALPGSVASLGNFACQELGLEAAEDVG